MLVDYVAVDARTRVTLMSMVWILAVSGVKDTRQRPPPSTCTWFGTSPSLMLISSCPSPAWEASTVGKKYTDYL